MAPPELAADAPVLDVPHPLEVRLRPVLRHEARAAVFHRGDGRRGERRDLHVPLVREIRLEHGAAAVAARHDEPMLLDVLEQARGFELRRPRACAPRTDRARGIARGTFSFIAARGVNTLIDCSECRCPIS